LGMRVEKTYELRRSKSPFLFKLLFPNSHIYVVVLLVIVAFLTSRLGHWRGSNEAVRDMQSPHYLIEVSLYSKDALPMEGTYNSITKLYEYSGFRLIDMNSEYVFITKGVSASTGAIETYAIPKQDGIVLRLSP